MPSGFGFPRAAGKAAVVFATLWQSIVADFDGSSYTRNVSLSESVDIFWTVDTATETIQVAVHAKAATGWAGIGISEMGGMEGADIVFYETATGELTDAHSLVAGTPVVDECTQDWNLVSAESDSGSLVFEAERALVTGDAQDRAFADDTQEGTPPTRLMAAWGDSESMSYHATNFAKGVVIVFGGPENADAEPLADVVSDPDASFFDVTTKEFPIPTERNWYEETCLTASDLPDLDEYHAIGFQGLIQDDTSEYVHHLVLKGFTGTPDCGQSCEEWVRSNFPSDSDSSYDDYGGSSPSSPYSSYSPSYTESYSYLESNNITLPDYCYFDFADVFAWAPGASDMELPDDVGFLFGNASGGFTSVNVQTHYNNPNGDEGLVDSSGVRVYYTEELRQSDMGVMQLGDPFIFLEGFPLPDGKLSVSFDCPSSCTEEHFEAEEVTVFSHFLHMHENGQRLETRQYRNDSSGNEVLVHSAEVEYYSFLQAGGHVLNTNDSVTIQKGDRFETECFYDTALSSVGSENVTFGLGSENEMCIDFVFYYPDQKVPFSGSCGLGACGGDVGDAAILESDSDFDRTFGIVDDCATSVAEDSEEDDSSSAPSSRASVPGLGVLALSATAAALVVGGFGLV
eukprot:g2458.t1